MLFFTFFCAASVKLHCLLQERYLNSLKNVCLCPSMDFKNFFLWKVQKKFFFCMFLMLSSPTF